MLDKLEHISKKIRKAEERKHETVIRQVQSLRSELFPAGSLQERRENILNFYLQDPQIIEKLKSAMDPFDYQFNCFIESD
jgi:bacillithiol synthase